MSNIERLYYNRDRLIADLCDMPETKKAYEKMEKTIGRELFAKYEDVICDCLRANEKQGFIDGFQYAVSLLTGNREVAV